MTNTGTRQNCSESLKNLLKNNWYILLLYIVFVATAFYYINAYNKIGVHTYINQFVGNAFFDKLFYYITYLGDGLVMPFLLLAIIFYNIRLGLYATVSFLIAAITTNILKYKFFSDIDRPKQIFEWTLHQPLKFVDISDINIHNSFPSGHATQAFAILMCLVFFSRRVEYKFLFFIIALLAAFSRVYLSQHWLTDIAAGSLIGLTTSIIFYKLILSNNKFEKLNKPLLKRLKTPEDFTK